MMKTQKRSSKQVKKHLNVSLMGAMTMIGCLGGGLPQSALAIGAGDADTAFNAFNNAFLVTSSTDSPLTTKVQFNPISLHAYLMTIITSLGISCIDTRADWKWPWNGASVPGQTA